MTKIERYANRFSLEICLKFDCGYFYHQIGIRKYTKSRACDDNSVIMVKNIPPIFFEEIDDYLKKNYISLKRLVDKAVCHKNTYQIKYFSA
jgi:hypothetical protein